MNDDDSYEDATEEELIEAAHDCDPEAVGELFRRECLKTARMTKALEHIARLANYWEQGPNIRCIALEAVRAPQADTTATPNLKESDGDVTRKETPT